MLELVFFVLVTGVVPVVINKSTEEARFDWIKPYLREIWTAIFVFFVIYFLLKPEAMEVAMKLHNRVPSFWGYLLVALAGGLLLCAYWWFTGKALSRPREQPQIQAAAGVPAPAAGIATPKSGDQARQQSPTLPPITKVDKFAVNIPFDAANENVPIPMDESTSDPNRAFYQDLLSLTGRPAAPIGGQPHESRNLGDVNTRIEFMRRLLQYYIFRSIDRLQRDGESYEWSIDKGARAVVRVGIPPPDGIPYSHEEIIAVLSKTPFFGPSDRLVWNPNHKFLVPAHTLVEFAEDSTYNSVVLKRAGYFRWEIKVTQSFGPIIVAGVPGASLPPGFKTSIPGVEGYPFVVTMNLQVERPNDPNFRPDDYVQWGSSTFSALKEWMAPN